MDDSMFGIPSSPPLRACGFPLQHVIPRLTLISYIFATLFAKMRWSSCSPSVLRIFNNAALLVMVSYASDCRALITLSWKPYPTKAISDWRKSHKPLSRETLHTALNIALFPSIFFFSGLFYTDVLSTCVVLRAYRLYLERQDISKNSVLGSIWLYLTGMVALTMRQTNIFWVAIFLAALEVIRSIKSEAGKEAAQAKVSQNWQETIILKVKQYTHGNIHDLLLKDAGIQGKWLPCLLGYLADRGLDYILCAISIAIAAVFRPPMSTVKLVIQLWPYILLLASFVGFLVWNGGVVLGDKSNHVATIHLPQLLYIWPFMAFFSAPLILPVGINFILDTFKLLRIPLFPRLIWKYLLIAVYISIALSATLLIIKFNTIIHPFTLADNRHYMFYVFRYTILRHPLLKFVLAPVYLICAWLVYLTLCTSPGAPTSTKFGDKRVGAPIASEPKSITKSSAASEGPTTSFIIVLIASTALSLVGAPLVEPRYFIIPWVIWRLNVPSPAIYDQRLYFETAWSLLLNFITGYMFLYRGFSWPQEPGNVQRFMW